MTGSKHCILFNGEIFEQKDEYKAQIFPDGMPTVAIEVPAPAAEQRAAASFSCKASAWSMATAARRRAPIFPRPIGFVFSVR